MGRWVSYAVGSRRNGVGSRDWDLVHIGHDAVAGKIGPILAEDRNHTPRVLGQEWLARFLELRCRLLRVGAAEERGARSKV
eukprot:2189887-Rhodomonas_salina.1